MSCSITLLPLSGNTSAPSSTSPREYWRQQSIIDHTDWKSLGTQAARVFWRLQLASSLALVSS
jgi:hypothetical protein